MSERLKEMFDKIAMTIADVDKDGDIDMQDVAKLLRRLESIAAIVIKVTPTGKDDAVFNMIVKPILDEVINALGG